MGYAMSKPNLRSELEKDLQAFVHFKFLITFFLVDLEELILNI